MSDIFDDTIDSVHEQKEAAAAGDTEGQNASTQADDTSDTQTSDLPAESEGTAGDGAREGEKGAEALGATTEDQFEFTGYETPEELERRHGSQFGQKILRRMTPLIRAAGTTANLKRAAELFSAADDPEATGETFGKAIEATIGPARWGELRDGIVGSALSDPEMPPERFNALVKAGEPFIWRVVELNADVVLRGLLKDETATLAEVAEALTSERNWKGQGQEQTPDPDDLSTLSPAVRKKLEDYDRLLQEVPGLRQTVTGMVESQKTQAEQKRAADIDSLGKELYGSVFSVVTERVNKLGLEPKQTDSPRIKGIKKSLRDALSQDSLEAAFESNADRKSLSEKAIRRVQALERDGALAYRDPLAVMAEMTLAEVLESEEVKSLLDALKSETLAQSTPKDPSARQEIVAGAPAASNPADRWKEIPKEVNPFDFGESLAREKSAAR